MFSNHPFPDGAKTSTANFQIPAQPAYAREPSLQQPLCAEPSLQPRCSGRRWPSCAEHMAGARAEPILRWGSRGTVLQQDPCSGTHVWLVQPFTL